MTSSVLERMCMMTSLPVREVRDTEGMERDRVSRRGSMDFSGWEELEWGR